MFGSRRTTHTRTTHHSSTPRRSRFGFMRRKDPARSAAGYKAALSNPNTTSVGRNHAKRELKAMGRGSEAHVPFSTRIRHWLHLGGRSKNRQRITESARHY